MTFEKFLEGVERMSQDRSLDWRYGQCLFNALDHYRQDIAVQLRGSKFDPFYKEKNQLTNDFWSWLVDKW